MESLWPDFIPRGRKNHINCTHCGAQAYWHSNTEYFCQACKQIIKVKIKVEHMKI